MSRRGVLAGSAAAVAAMALGACASDGSETAAPASSEAAASPPPSASASESASASADPTGEGSPTGDPVAGTNDFPVGGGVVVTTSAGPVVITHPTDDEFVAFDGRCPHAGCPVAEVLENTILCNCHGSVFDGTTGQRLEGPAPTGLEPVPVQVEGGEIYLA